MKSGYLTIDEALGEKPHRRRDVRDDVDARIVEALETDGIRLGNGERVRFEDVVPAEGYQVLTHRARGAGARNADTFIALFGPDETVNRFAERRAVNEATLHEDVENLLLIGFGFEASPKKEQLGRVAVHRVQAHQDLRIRELAPDSKADTLVVVAEPDIELSNTGKGEWTLEVKGFDSYNPATEQVASHQGANEIECLMIDTDYDGSAFFARAPLPGPERGPEAEAAEGSARSAARPRTLGDVPEREEPSVRGTEERRSRRANHHPSRRGTHSRAPRAGTLIRTHTPKRRASAQAGARCIRDSGRGPARPWRAARRRWLRTQHCPGVVVRPGMVRVGVLGEDDELARIVGPVAQRSEIERAPHGRRPRRLPEVAGSPKVAEQAETARGELARAIRGWRLASVAGAPRSRDSFPGTARSRFRPG